MGWQGGTCSCLSEWLELLGSTEHETADGSESGPIRVMFSLFPLKRPVFPALTCEMCFFCSPECRKSASSKIDYV